MVDEMVHNSCKYAFSEVEDPVLELSFTANAATGWQLAYQDNGPGFDPLMKPQGTGYGLGFIKDAISDLNATYTLATQGGVRWEVVIPTNKLG